MNALENDEFTLKITKLPLGKSVQIFIAMKMEPIKGTQRNSQLQWDVPREKQPDQPPS